MDSQHWPQSKGAGTPWASTHHLPPVLSSFFDTSLSPLAIPSDEQSAGQSISHHLQQFITTWPDTSYHKCTFTLWILVVGLWDNVLAAGGLQDGALERRKQKLPPSRQSHFQPDAYKIKHLQGFHLCKCSMLKIGIYLLEWLTLLHWYISQLLHIYLMNAVRYFTYKRP